MRCYSMLGKDEILFVGTMFMNTWLKHVSVSRRNANNLGGKGVPNEAG